jgi:hypothetical protein
MSQQERSNPPIPGASNTEDGKLERLAEAINGRWPEADARYRSYAEPHIVFTEMMRYRPTADDDFNARFIVWAFARLAELGCDPMLLLGKGGQMGVISNRVVNHRANTHAEAIANALYTALTSKDTNHE